MISAICLAKPRRLLPTKLTPNLTTEKVMAVTQEGGVVEAPKDNVHPARKQCSPSSKHYPYLNDQAVQSYVRAKSARTNLASIDTSPCAVARDRRAISRNTRQPHPTSQTHRKLLTRNHASNFVALNDAQEEAQDRTPAPTRTIRTNTRVTWSTSNLSPPSTWAIPSNSHLPLLTAFTFHPPVG